jgi:(S)-ureidoglycine aminohydrolase
MTKKQQQCYRDHAEKNTISKMKKISLNICFFIPFLFASHYGPVTPGVYDWKQPVKNTGANIRSSVLFEGTAFEMEWLQMSANALSASKKETKIILPQTEEYLYIVKKGTLDVRLKDSSSSLVPGSVLVLMPGENLSIQNKQSGPCEYFVMKYRSQVSIDNNRGDQAGGSFVKDWNKIEFKPHDRGGVRTFFERPTAMLKRMEMHVTTLNAGLKSHDPHTHLAKEIIVMMQGNTEMQIGEKIFKGKEGSVYFMESNVLHGIRNEGTTPCTYFAIQFE